MSVLTMMLEDLNRQQAQFAEAVARQREERMKTETELTPAQEREYVESKWFLPDVRLDGAGPTWAFFLQGVLVAQYSNGTFCKSPEEAWHAGFVFTQERERQIAQFEEQNQECVDLIEYGRCNRAPMKRTLALLQRELAQAKQGMK